MNKKTRRCSSCRKKVPADSIYQSNLKAFCSSECLVQYVRSPQGEKTRHKAVQSDLRQRKAKLKTKGQWMKEAQAAFNAYVRARDRHYKRRCISCDKFLNYEKTGGEVDAGHYIARGSMKGHSLRFHLWNCHAQCVACNRHRNGNVSGYRVGLVWRIGHEKVEWLEDHDHQVDYSVDYLKRIKNIFAKKCKKMVYKFHEKS